MWLLHSRPSIIGTPGKYRGIWSKWLQAGLESITNNIGFNRCSLNDLYFTCFFWANSILFMLVVHVPQLYYSYAPRLLLLIPRMDGLATCTNFLVIYIPEWLPAENTMSLLNSDKSQFSMRCQGLIQGIRLTTTSRKHHLRSDVYHFEPEEVGHGHVTYVRKRIHAVSLRRILYWKNDQNFLGTFFDYPKEIGIIRKR